MYTLQCGNVALCGLGEMTWQLETRHDAGLTWIIDNGHGARIRGDDRWNLSPAGSEREVACKVTRRRAESC
jgi:hypothetical protein